ncbi:MAG: transcriptional regulator [Acidobacteria bacterium]|nr:MAG: transcriptional regulator [Acidobacteriota bacterium]
MAPVPDITTRDPVSSAGVALLGSPVRRGVVDQLAALDAQGRAQGLTAAELGERLGLHTTTIRFHVDQLVAAGVLDAHFVRSGGVGRPSKKYVLREDPLAASARQGGRPFEVLAELLTSTLSVAESERLTPEQAGERWATRRAEQVAQVRAAVLGDAGGAAAVPGDAADVRDAKVAEVIALLAEWGYTPERHVLEDGSGVDVTLRACPFIDLARTHPDVVCGVHRGLLRGALAAVGEPDTHVSLEPFVGPDTCRARLHLPGPDVPVDDLPEDDQRRARP